MSLKLSRPAAVFAFRRQGARYGPLGHGACPRRSPAYKKTRPPLVPRQAPALPLPDPDLTPGLVARPLRRFLKACCFWSQHCSARLLWARDNNIIKKPAGDDLGNYLQLITFLLVTGQIIGELWGGSHISALTTAIIEESCCGAFSVDLRLPMNLD